MNVYLDYNAGAPIRPEVRTAVAASMEIGGNASSVHAVGRAARSLIEEARSEVAGLVGRDPQQLIFTSGGTEANGLAVASALKSGCGPMIIGATEHPSVMEAVRAEGRAFELLPVDVDGVADLNWLERRLAGRAPGDGAPFVALMAVNNETGAVQPVAEAAGLVGEAGGWLHVDAVAAAGRTSVSLNATTLSLSAHKLGGLSGVGALFMAQGAPISRRIHGGGQERGRRAGTENLAGVVGFGAAAKAARLASRRGPASEDLVRAFDAASARLKAAGALVVSENTERAPLVMCVAAEGFAASLQVMALDLEGVMVSAGSACSSGKVTPSGVLQAMGLGPLAGCAIRASGGWATTPEDWDRFAEVWLSAFARHTHRHSVKEVA